MSTPSLPLPEITLLLIALLEAAGFGLCGVSADYEGRPFDAAVSPKMVILAEAT